MLVITLNTCSFLIKILFYNNNVKQIHFITSPDTKRSQRNKSRIKKPGTVPRAHIEHFPSCFRDHCWFLDTNIRRKLRVEKLKPLSSLDIFDIETERTSSKSSKLLRTGEQQGGEFQERTNACSVVLNRHRIIYTKKGFCITIN